MHRTNGSSVEDPAVDPGRGAGSDALGGAVQNHDWDGFDLTDAPVAETEECLRCLEKAAALEDEEKFEAALEAYDEAIELDDESATLRRARANLLVNSLSMPHLALHDLTWIVETTPDDPNR